MSPVKVVPTTIEELERQLQKFESEFGMSSADFAASYGLRDLPGDEEQHLAWIMTFEAWRLAREAAPRR